MMVGNVHRPDDVTPLAEMVLDTMTPPFSVEGTEVFASASLGVSIAPADGENAERLLQNAELATIESKRSGGSMFRFYNPSFNQLAKNNLELDRLLRKSLECHEFSLSYQPIVRVKDGRIVGAEALLRWNHPELGRVPPLDFIPIAEETGLMVPIGAWVLRTACEELKSWIDDDLPPMRMSVNVALCQLLRGGLTEIVEGILKDIGVPPELLELELSERGVLRNSSEIVRQLNAIKTLGVRLSVDDFGTGDSAIAYLKGFDLDVLKIDRSYIRGIPHNEDDSAIASAMVAMAHQLKMTVVAEGVEKPEQLEALRSWGCDEFQGFMVSPPVPSEEFRELIEREPFQPSQRDRETRKHDDNHRRGPEPSGVGGSSGVAKAESRADQENRSRRTPARIGDRGRDPSGMPADRLGRPAPPTLRSASSVSRSMTVSRSPPC